ncbi:MAG: hypothetical protein IPM16_23185 [Chloroflexi bacterium]|nr:hypothetical protein [Chloroflexota bacterium]
MMNRSPFADEWRACLREHYKHTVRENDRATLATLTGVMINVGFREDELRDLTIEATMRTEDVADDFVPNLDILTPQMENRHPAECQCPSCVGENLVPHDAEGQPLTGDALQEAEEEARWAAERSRMLVATPTIADELDGAEPDEASDEDYPRQDPEGFTQLSLF